MAILLALLIIVAIYFVPMFLRDSPAQNYQIRLWLFITFAIGIGLVLYMLGAVMHLLL